MLRRVPLPDWTVYIALELLIIYIACDSACAVCVRAWLASPTVPSPFIASLFSLESASALPLCHHSVRPRRARQCAPCSIHSSNVTFSVLINAQRLSPLNSLLLCHVAATFVLAAAKTSAIVRKGNTGISVLSHGQKHKHSPWRQTLLDGGRSNLAAPTSKGRFYPESAPG